VRPTRDPRIGLRWRGRLGGGLSAVCVLAVVAGCTAPLPPPAGERSGASTPGPAPAPGPRFAAGGPDSEEYGAGAGYPIGDSATYFRIPFLVGSHSHLDEIFEGRVIRRAERPSRLTRSAEPAIEYRFDGETRTLDDYLARNPATGLLVARGETILVERYQYGRTDRERFTSWSMAKTVTAMLVGIAIAEGRIRSVEELAGAYVPELRHTEYGHTSLRHLLQMSSGVAFVEQYTGTDDVSRLVADTFRQVGPGGVAAVTPFNERVRPSGTRFAYASVETQVLGLVLRNAVGRPVAEYLQEKIWGPIGAEADATWLIDRAGQEATYCCVNAVLRDYARLGLLLAHDGNWRGRQLVPAAWLEEATRVAHDQPHLQPRVATPFFGYGYQVWIVPGERRMFALLGVRGRGRRLARDRGGRAEARLPARVRQLLHHRTGGAHRPGQRRLPRRRGARP
jgi:CubicO group peptidase (beta-lactamase class C family)